jgi:hypothetical protein
MALKNGNCYVLELNEVKYETSNLLKNKGG